MNPPTRTALLLLAYDSQLTWAHAYGTELAARGFSCRYAVPTDVRGFVGDEQARALGVTLTAAAWDELLDAALDADVVIVSLQGSLVSRFVRGLVERASERGAHLPVVVTGWVGMVVEKLVGGYLDRFASDVVAVGSRADLRVFTQTAALLDLPTDNLVMAGLPQLPARPAPARRGPLRTVLFADQPTVPSSREDRAYVYDRLVRHARLYPDRRVLLKPRHRPGDEGGHVPRHRPEQLLAGRELPPNFEIVYGPISDLLASVDLMLTVSSTAGLESVGAGVRTAFVGDLGVHENLGNHVLLASGLVRTFDTIDAFDADPLEPRPEWVDDLFCGSDVDPRTPAQRVVDRIVELAAVPAVDRPLSRAVDTAYYRGRAEVAAHRSTSAPEQSVRRSVQTVRWRSGVRGRVLLACHAVLPAGWEDWSWVERLRER